MPAAKVALVDPANEAFLSSVSAWEIAVENRLGRLPLPERPGSWVRAQREAHAFDSLPLDELAALSLDKLPDLHRDPFDRMLVRRNEPREMTEKLDRVKMAVNVPVDASAPESPEVAALVREYSARIDRVAQRIVGRTWGPLNKDPLETGESTLGSFIADAQRAGTRADVAMTNLGGIRSDLGLGGAEVTFGDLFQIQPFDNRMVIVEMRGAELLDILESQWHVSGEWGLYQISSSLRYCRSEPDPTGSRIIRSSVRVGGRTLEEDATYTVALNSYLANKPPFADAPRARVLGSDVDALEELRAEARRGFDLRERAAVALDAVAARM